ncbi:MAG: hypothetical protein Q7R90_01805 [bacterium]|nr:hypothetical protein [bacterium]
MIGKSAGFLALLVFLFCGALYVGYQTESSTSRLALTAAGEAGVTPAATPSVTSPVINIDGDAQCPVPKANQGYNAKYPYNAQYKDGTMTKTNLYDKECTEVQSKLNIKGKCRAAGECCAKEYQDFDKGWHNVLVDCKVGAGTGGSASAPGGTANPGAAPALEKPAAPSPKPAETPPIKPAAPPPDNLSPAYRDKTDVMGRQTAPTGPTAIDNIRAESARTGALPGQPGQTTFPGQIQTATQPGGSAFEQGGFYRAGGTNPSGELSGGSRPGYFSPSRAQTTFGSSGLSPRSSARTAGSFISGIASLIGGLFSVPTNSVVNYVQSFVGGASQQAPANQNSGQQQTYAPGQVIVVVPYPMPTSRKGDTLAQLPPPPTSTTDAYAELREMARQANGTLAPAGVQEDRITSAFSGQEGETRPGTAPGGNQNANGGSGATPAGRQGGVSLGGELMGTTSVPEGKATSTHATTTSYKEPRVVEVGIPVDITDPLSAIIGYLKGDWARTERTALQNKMALAQAESQQDAIRAQLEALQDARAAGLCDDSCAASLTVLQNELPVLQSRVEALQTAVEKDAQPRPSSPPPTVAQIHRVAESLAEPTYKATSPRSAAGEPTGVSVAEQEALPEVPQTKSEAVVTRVVQTIWNFLKSIFLPPTTDAAKPRPSCSLFASLFGKCK